VVGSFRPHECVGSILDRSVSFPLTHGKVPFVVTRMSSRSDRTPVVSAEGSPAKKAPPRLRATPLARPFHLVLVEPEIPPNTGNVARLGAATGSPLHLVGRLGFRIDEHSVRRAGVDYWHLVDVRTHVDFAHFLHAFEQDRGRADPRPASDEASALEAPQGAAPPGRLHLFSALAERSYLDAGFLPGDALVFGRESVGLPEDLVEKHKDRLVGIPTLGAVRSLNLANAVGIALYEALRQCGALSPTFIG
jgi:tRNA (cytidine/uridine-2'-O-)-methyltransferase